MPAMAEFRPIADGFLLLTPKGVSEDVTQDVPEAERNVMVATQAATQGALLATPINAADWHTKPSWFVVASNGRTISPDAYRSFQPRCNAGRA